MAWDPEVLAGTQEAGVFKPLHWTGRGGRGADGELETPPAAGGLSLEKAAEMEQGRSNVQIREPSGPTWGLLLPAQPFLPGPCALDWLPD